MTNYTIIKDLEGFQQFIDWLPILGENEVYYVSLFARKKYHESAKNDKSNLKRFIARDKDWLVRKIKQLEVPLGSYFNKDGSPVDQQALALYICINPRDLKKAQKGTIRDLLDKHLEGQFHIDPSQVALTNIHKAKGSTRFVDLDFDVPWEDWHGWPFKGVINKDACSVLITRGGFHLLVDPSKVDPLYNKWYTTLKGIDGCDVTGDTMIPVGGCTQGNFTPYLWRTHATHD